MIRILKFFLFLAIIFISIITINYLDTKMLVRIYNYQIDISLFLLIFVVIVFWLLIYILFKAIYNIINIPCFLYSKYTNNIANKEIDSILNCYANILISPNQARQKLQLKSQDSNYKAHIILISYALESNFEKKIIYLTQLSQIKEYEFYSYYQLTQIMLEYKNYEQALVDGKKAISYDKGNLDINWLLLEIYMNLFMWEEFIEIFVFLKKQNNFIVNNKAKLMSKYLIFAAKNITDSGKVTGFLENALVYDVANLEALELLCEINIANKKIEENKILLDNAFLAFPSFDLFLLYIHYSDMTQTVLYEELAMIVNPTNNLNLFLSIAAFLNDFDKINNIKVFCNKKHENIIKKDVD